MNNNYMLLSKMVYDRIKDKEYAFNTLIIIKTEDEINDAITYLKKHPDASDNNIRYEFTKIASKRLNIIIR